MEKFITWLKEQSKKPRFFAKILALILIFIILIMPKNQTDNNENQDSGTAETTSSYEQSSSSEEKEENSSEYEFHIGTTNLIALAGGIIALAVVKNKERRFLNKHDKK
ncbi:MAG: hypothetical protein ACI4SF_02960 [Oscillospiraceae bacterium]